MTDITGLLFRIKENITEVENGNDAQVILNEIKSDFLEFLELAKLFLISERDSYYGYFLMNMQFCPDFSAKTIAGIKLGEFPPVFQSNPLLLCKFTLKEILYIICHEIDHVVFNHPAEMLKSNPDNDADVFYDFNLAADASVNDRINYEISTEKKKFLSPPDGLITSDELKKIYKIRRIERMESYAYYFELISGKKKSPVANSAVNGYEKILSQNDDNYDAGAEEDVALSDDNSDNNGKIITSHNCGKLSDHNWDISGDAEDASAAVRELVNSSVSMMSEESRSMMPASFISNVEKINAPPAISWQILLKKYVGAIVAGKKKTSMRLNRRQPQRFDLSGSVDDKILKIVVAVDTSASVDDNMISQIFNEIFAILSKRKHEITVIECDSEVQRVYRARHPSEIRTKVKGRGGTWFSPVIDYINRDRYFRDALLIYFTDGFGEYEIPKPRTYRNIWVVFDNEKNLSLKEAYGMILKF